MAATIVYRSLDANGDPQYGNNLGCFLTDIDAVAQAIGTRIKLFMGEWWENLATGTPVFQSMLGVSGAGKRPGPVSLLLKQRILGTPYVTGVSNVVTANDANARAFTFSCQAQTPFGVLLITYTPGATAVVLY